MAARLCIVRHGETAWNAEGRVQGQLDLPLSEIGLAQARCVAAARPEHRFSALYSSDLQRVVQTAQPAAQKLRLEMRLDPRRRATGCGLSSVRNFELPNAAFNRFEDWKILGWADCEHLATA